MPPIPPPPGIAGAELSFGTSATIASVVTSRPATEAASWRARRTTLAGPTQLAEVLYRTAHRLLMGTANGKKRYRLIGVGISLVVAHC